MRAYEYQKIRPGVYELFFKDEWSKHPPTEDQIRLRARAIQNGWDDVTRRHRAFGSTGESPPMVHKDPFVRRDPVVRGNWQYHGSGAE